jgi:glycosyltransferase involved in cell wall biosynthesis
MKSKKIILCLISEYLPGFRSGGPVKSIANLIDQLGDEFKIHIICSDRDLGEKEPYPNIKIDKWSKLGKAKVFYASRRMASLTGMIKLLRETRYDILYLNSFFSFSFTILPLFIRYLGIVKLKPCAIAPRGEFNKNALAFKKKKKFFYLWFVKLFGLYDNLYWQASSHFELLDIRKKLSKVPKKIKIATDLISVPRLSLKKSLNINPGNFRIIFLSRISPMKNLDYLIEVLIKVKKPLQLSIFGPKIDLKYWSKCKRLLKKLPSHIKVSINEEVSPTKVQEVFSQHDLFAFPTKGENFGHIILESLSAGTPVLVSDKTLWQEDKSLGLQTLPLNNNLWVNIIEKWACLTHSNLLKRRNAALSYAKKIKIRNKKSLIENKNFFYDIV